MEVDQDVGVRPDVWSVPSSGQDWCECGEGHELCREHVSELADSMGIGPDGVMTHQQVVKLTMMVWNYAGVCRFFHMKLEDASLAVHGKVATHYSYAVAIDIVGYFSKNWQGCPDESCTPEP